MSRARHTIKRASGGSVPDKVSGNPNVFKEAAMNVVTVLALMKEMTAPKPPSGPSVLPPPSAFVSETPVKADWISPTSSN